MRCVHATRGINSGSKVVYGGITPLKFDAGNYNAGFMPKNQGEYWSNVHKTTAGMNAAMGKKVQNRASYSSLRGREAGPIMGGPTGQSLHDEEREIPVGAIGASAFFAQAQKADDLCGTFQEFSLHFDEILSKVKRLENQAGLALINQSEVETIEFFDHQESWKVLHEAAVKRLGANIVDKDQDSVFEFKPENAEKMVNRVLDLDWKLNEIYRHRQSNGEPEVEITGLTAERFVGEAVEVNGTLIHLVILRQE